MARRKARYSTRIAKRICEHIALGDTLKGALEKEPLGPHIMTFWRWLDEYPELRVMYDRARQMQADLRVDAIAEMAQQVLKQPKNAPAYKVASDILWRQCEISNPEKYGRKIEVNNKNTPMNPAAISGEIKRLEKELGLHNADVVDVTPTALPSPEDADDGGE